MARSRPARDAGAVRDAGLARAPTTSGRVGEGPVRLAEPSVCLRPGASLTGAVEGRVTGSGVSGSGREWPEQVVEALVVGVDQSLVLARPHASHSSSSSWPALGTDAPGVVDRGGTIGRDFERGIPGGAQHGHGGRVPDARRDTTGRATRAISRIPASRSSMGWTTSCASTASNSSPVNGSCSPTSTRTSARGNVRAAGRHERLGRIDRCHACGCEQIRERRRQRTGAASDVRYPLLNVSRPRRSAPRRAARRSARHGGRMLGGATESFRAAVVGDR